MIHFRSQALLDRLPSPSPSAMDQEDSPFMEEIAEYLVTPFPMEGFQVVPKVFVRNRKAIFAIGSSIQQWRRTIDWNAGLAPLTLRLIHQRKNRPTPFQRRIDRLQKMIKRKLRSPHRCHDPAWNAKMMYVAVFDGDLENEKVSFFSYVVIVTSFVVVVVVVVCINHP